MLPSPRASSPPALAALVAANALPLAGVLWFGWSVPHLLVVYWVESGVVGLLNVPKILVAAGSGDAGFTATVNGRPLDLSGPDETDRVDGLHVYPGNLPIAGFFCAHYGIFWVVHGAFVLFGLPGVAGQPLALVDLPVVLIGGFALAVSHGGSFLWNYLGAEEYRSVSPGQQMGEPYRRVVVLHLTIIFGGMLVASYGAPVLLVALLVLLKTGFDVAVHLREHRRARDRSAPTVGESSDPSAAGQ